MEISLVIPKHLIEKFGEKDGKKTLKIGNKEIVLNSVEEIKKKITSEEIKKQIGKDEIVIAYKISFYVKEEQDKQDKKQDKEQNKESIEFFLIGDKYEELAIKTYKQAILEGKALENAKFLKLFRFSYVDENNSLVLPVNSDSVIVSLFDGSAIGYSSKNKVYTALERDNKNFKLEIIFHNVQHLLDEDLKIYDVKAGQIIAKPLSDFIYIEVYVKLLKEGIEKKINPETFFENALKF